jgi:DNA polymerase
MNENSYKEKLLQELYEPYFKCTACPLGKLGRSTVVFGEGNPNARLVFIGEGPGKDEDLQGRPFIGRSGKLLTRLLHEELGMKRSEVFITNIVKCRPPANRKPTPHEASTCSKLLLFKQLEIIRPQIICSLGATALEGLLHKKVKLADYRGKKITLSDSIILIPTYHPAYILRNQKKLQIFVDDLLLIQQTLTVSNNS